MTLMEQIDLFSLPVEMYASKDAPARERLHSRACRMLGVAPKPLKQVDEEEVAFIRDFNAAVIAGDTALAERLEQQWNARIEQRRKDEGAKYERGRSQWSGNVGKLRKAQAELGI